ncbi:hypothetical protein TVAG_157850 [Trichomonas vaginalis G3]|uniref:Uncharacterized protein n=1 Tax=Trichomonas vaginalis (strain ATCC PRA-98 / G3) TaxID=412133 RepID=A2FBC0_TRIV3|nr:armadillo (ARM) repeat-containing protein family [Trichomonas vaginalis G3]EAX97800.1 hypothetical protein TVAG_157850 [Trichomonas vaginalis G3]KAI5552724.1 armadillo (ARM) repeat-containing protein family [Trichomonas vaginalis G3]|eukprot:XP_001310730.1 hypothetical protein [Trichomonas vaginalis G3]
MSDGPNFVELLEIAFSPEQPNQEALDYLTNFRRENPIDFLFECISALPSVKDSRIMKQLLIQISSILNGGKYTLIETKPQFLNELEQKHNCIVAFKELLLQCICTEGISDDKSLYLIISQLILIELKQKSNYLYSNLVAILNNCQPQTRLGILEIFVNTFKSLTFTLLLLRDLNLHQPISQIIGESIDDEENVVLIFKLIEAVCYSNYGKLVYDNDEFIANSVEWFRRITPEVEIPEIIKSFFGAFTNFFKAEYKKIFSDETNQEVFMSLVLDFLKSSNAYGVKYSLRFIRKIARFENSLPEKDSNHFISQYSQFLLEPITAQLNGLSDDDNSIEFQSADDESIATEAYSTLLNLTEISPEICLSCAEDFFNCLDNKTWNTQAAGLLGLAALVHYTSSESAIIIQELLKLNNDELNIILIFMENDNLRLRSIVMTLMQNALDYNTDTAFRDRDYLKVVSKMIIQGLKADSNDLRLSCLSLLESFSKIFDASLYQTANALNELLKPITEIVITMLNNYKDNVILINDLFKAYESFIIRISYSEEPHLPPILNTFRGILNAFLQNPEYDYIICGLIRIITCITFKCSNLDPNIKHEIWNDIYQIFSPEDGQLDSTDCNVLTSLNIFVQFMPEIAVPALGNFPIELLAFIPDNCTDLNLSSVFHFIYSVYIIFPTMYQDQFYNVMERLLTLVNENFEMPIFPSICIALGAVILSNTSEALAKYEKEIALIPLSVEEMAKGVDKLDSGAIQNLRDMFTSLFKLFSAIALMYIQNDGSRFLNAMKTALFKPFQIIEPYYIDENYADAAYSFMKTIMDNSNFEQRKPIQPNLANPKLQVVLTWITKHCQNRNQFAEDAKRMSSSLLRI